MKYLNLLFVIVTFSLMTFVLTACSKSATGTPSILASGPYGVTLAFATTSSGSLQFVNASTNAVYATVTSSPVSAIIPKGTHVRAIWTPAAGDTNTAAYWLNSRGTTGQQAAGLSEYDFTVTGAATVKMHLQSGTTNAVQINPPQFGLISWTLNGVTGQLATGGTMAALSVRASDDFSLTWSSTGGTPYYISLWELAGPVLSDRSLKDVATISPSITAATTITTEMTVVAPPHIRMGIPVPQYGVLDFINPDSGLPTVLTAGDLRYGTSYQVVTAGGVSALNLQLVYDDLGSGFSLASFTELGVPTPLTTVQDTISNSDTSLRFKVTWTCNLGNAGVDHVLTLSYLDTHSSCTGISQLYVAPECFDGPTYCTAHGQTWNASTLSCI